MPELTGPARNAGQHTPRHKWTCTQCGQQGPGGAYSLQLHIDQRHAITADGERNQWLI